MLDVMLNVLYRIHEKDNSLPTTPVVKICGVDSDTDKKRYKKLLEAYGFILEDDEDGFHIIGVKE